MPVARTPSRTVLWDVGNLSPDQSAGVEHLRRAVADAGWEEPTGGTADVVLAWHAGPLDEERQSRLLAHAAAGSRLLLVGPTLAWVERSSGLTEATGILVDRWSLAHEVRVRPGGSPPWQPSLRPPETTLPDQRVLLVDKVLDDVEVLLTANVALTDHPVSSYRPSTRVGIFTLDVPPGHRPGDRVVGVDYLRLLLASMASIVAAGTNHPRGPVGVGLLGYGAIGAEHSRAVSSTTGLRLTAVCDRSPQRLAAAQLLAPDVFATADADGLLAAADVDLVVVSTPPDSHARWALQALDAGKHVVIEKPFALTTAEADEVLESAEDKGLLAVVYQNRRFDPDFLAIKRLVHEGRLGRLFRAEAFVGGFGHPCNYWHSDEHVSGGAIFDWGAHVLDQLLDLVPSDIEFVTGSEHKLVWHDVTNADHSRVTIRFSDGTEVEFTHSDAAAALKPRWYILGTQGAVVGQWRNASVVTRNEIGTLEEDVMAPADAPPVVFLHDTNGSVTEVASPPAPGNAFHQQVADLLHLGVPMTVTGGQARRVLSVMEAARTSAMSDGRPVTPR